MKLTDTQLKQLSQEAITCAKQAGEVIQNACVEELNIENKEQATSIALLHEPLGYVGRFDAAAKRCSLNLNRTVECSVE